MSCEQHTAVGSWSAARSEGDQQRGRLALGTRGAAAASLGEPAGGSSGMSRSQSPVGKSSETVGVGGIAPSIAAAAAPKPPGLNGRSKGSRLSRLAALCVRFLRRRLAPRPSLALLPALVSSSETTEGSSLTAPHVTGASPKPIAKAS